MFCKLLLFGCVLATVNLNVEGSPVVNSTDHAEREEHRDFVRRNLIPTRQYCGFQHNDDRFSTANTTELDEFPWLVQILIRFDNVSYFDHSESRCHGVLINNRYVLTIRKCAVGQRATTVRLGQHTLGKKVTCNPENPLYTDCSEPTIKLGILHTSIYADGLALLRLDNSDYVRPICLPINDTNRATNQESLVLSGWGASDHGAVIKKKLTFSTVSIDECYKVGVNFKKGNARSDYVMCLAPHSNNTETACAGDRGAPLIYSMRRSQWFVDALTADTFLYPSKGYCSNSSPIVATRLTEKILNWILDEIQP